MVYCTSVFILAILEWFSYVDLTYCSDADTSDMQWKQLQIQAEFFL